MPLRRLGRVPNQKGAGTRHPKQPAFFGPACAALGEAGACVLRGLRPAGWEDPMLHPSSSAQGSVPPCPLRPSIRPSLQTKNVPLREWRAGRTLLARRLAVHRACMRARGLPPRAPAKTSYFPIRILT
eukprot:2029427-Pleurochrysis_carterae.AAC.2